MTVYKAHMSDMLNGEGVFVYCHRGELSACGEWVEIGDDTRFRRTPEWQASADEARAMLAPKLAEIGAKILRQSQSLMNAAWPAPVEA